MFVDTLPSPCYDMLIVNTFMEFGHLVYSMGRIENGIKSGKIVDNGANMMEKERVVPDEHVQVISREIKSKKKSYMARDESIAYFPHSSSYAQVPLVDFPSPQKFARKYDQESDSSCPRDNKREKTKVYHSLPMSYRELFPILIQNYEISVIPARPRRLPYPKRYDVNAKCEYHGGVEGHSVENCTAFKDKV